MSPFLLLFLLLLLTQVVFIATLGTRIFSWKNSGQKSEATVSIIIAAKNEAGNLPRLLEKLVEQEHPNFEVIVVNDRSTDETKDILKHWEAKYPFIRVIHIDTLPASWTGKKHALFQAVSIAKKEVLLFTDADCKPASKQWIKSMTSSFSQGTDIVLGYSPYFKKPGLLNSFIQFETLLVGIQYLGLSLLGKSYMAVGRNMAMRRVCYDLDFLESIKSLEGGDDDLMISQLSAQKKNITVQISESSLVYTEPMLNLKSYLKQKVRHLSAGKHYRKKDQTLLGIFTLSWLVGWGSFLFLIFYSQELNLILMAFGLRSLTLYLILHRLGRKLNTDINFWALPLLDLCYCFYYPWVAIKALATKQIEWK